MARGAAIACVSKAQRNGIPIDNAAVDEFNAYWDEVKDSVIQRFNKDLNLWDENSKFSNEKFRQLIERLDLSVEWPRTPKGKLKINNNTLELFADAFPEIKKTKKNI